MNHEARQQAGSAGKAGTRPLESSATDRLHSLQIRERLAAIVDELRLLDAEDVDVPLTLPEGLLEDVEAA